MDQQEPRKQFMENLHSFCEMVELNEALIEGLKGHSNKSYIPEAMVKIFLNYIHLNNIFKSKILIEILILIEIR